MATVRLELSTSSKRAVTGSTLPLADGPETGSENKTSAATSSQFTLTAQSGSNGLVWQIRADGGDVYAKFGSNPTAVSGQGRLIKNGEWREFAVGADGEKCAIIDA